MSAHGRNLPGPATRVRESPGYQIARERINGNPVIAMMAAGVVTLPLGELAHEEGRPALSSCSANRVFDQAESQNAGNPCYQPYPADAPRHIGLIAEAVLAERAAIREAVASAMAAPGTSPESASLSSQCVEALDTIFRGRRHGCRRTRCRLEISVRSLRVGYPALSATLYAVDNARAIAAGLALARRSR
jgi:hypothetical protein